MHHCRPPNPPINTYVPTQARDSQTGTAWTPEAPQRQRCLLFDSVTVDSTSLLLASQTLSHHWPCDLTLSKSFAKAAVHRWAQKVSRTNHRGGFPLNGGGLRQIQTPVKGQWCISGQEIYRSTSQDMNMNNEAVHYPVWTTPCIFLASLNTLFIFIRHSCFR